MPKQVFKSKYGLLPGSSYDELIHDARIIYREIAKKSKRTPYIKSPLFDKEKIFLDLFWTRLNTIRGRKRRVERLKYYKCAIDLLSHSSYKIESKKNRDNPKELVWEFIGVTKNGEPFAVHIKQGADKKKMKHLMSCFPKKSL